MDAKIKIQSEIKSGKYVEPKDATVKELVAAWLEAGRTRGRHQAREMENPDLPFPRNAIQLHRAEARRDQGVEAPQVADRASGRGVERGQKLGGRERAPQHAERGFQMGAQRPGHVRRAG